jgi:MFS family permease
MYFKEKNFFFLLIAQFISLMGDRMATLVFFSLVVSLTGVQTGLYASLVVALQFIPLFLFGYFFGLLADVYNKKNLMLFADLARAGLIAVLLLCQNSLTLVFILVFLIGSFEALFDPTKKAIIPFIVSSDNLIQLNKLYALMEILAMLFGIAIGTFFLKFFSITELLIFDVGTYLFSFILVLCISYDAKEIVKKKTSHLYSELQDVSTKLKEGLKYVFNNRDVCCVIGNITFFHYLTVGFLYASISELNVVDAHSGAEAGTGVGLAILAATLGGAFGAAVLKNSFAQYKDSLISRSIFLTGALVMMLSGLFFHLGHFGYYTSFLVLFFFGMCAGMLYIRILYLLHLKAEGNYLGRVISLNDITGSFALISGIALGAVFSNFFGFAFGIFFSGLLYLMAFFSYRMLGKQLSW